MQIEANNEETNQINSISIFQTAVFPLYLWNNMSSTGLETLWNITYGTFNTWWICPHFIISLIISEGCLYLHEGTALEPNVTRTWLGNEIYAAGLEERGVARDKASLNSEAMPVGRLCAFSPKEPPPPPPVQWNCSDTSSRTNVCILQECVLREIWDSVNEVPPRSWAGFHAWLPWWSKQLSEVTDPGEAH